MATLFKSETKWHCAMFFPQNCEGVYKTSSCTPLPVWMQIKSIHSFWILVLFSLDTIFGSPLIDLIHNRSSGACCLCDFSSDDRGPWPCASFLAVKKEGRGGWHHQRHQLQSGMKWRSHCLKKTWFAKKSCGVRRGNGGFLEWRPPFLFVIGDSAHVCEAAFRLLIQMRNTETSWRTMNRAVGVYAYIVLTALNVFQPNKHFITAASSTVAALLHQQKMFGL